MTGTVTGFYIGKNRNGNKNVVMLQVKLRDLIDIQSIELMTPPGDDSIPPEGAKVTILTVSDNYKIAIAQSDDIAQEMDEGEKKIYSQAAGIQKAFIKLLKDGIIEINGNNDFMARFNELKSGFDQLKSDYNLHKHPETGSTTGVPDIISTASIDAAKVDEVKVI